MIHIYSALVFKSQASNVEKGGGRGGWITKEGKQQRNKEEGEGRGEGQRKEEEKQQRNKEAKEEEENKLKKKPLLTGRRRQTERKSGNEKHNSDFGYMQFVLNTLHSSGFICIRLFYLLLSFCISIFRMYVK